MVDWNLIDRHHIDIFSDIFHIDIGSVEFTTVPAAGGGGISNTAVPAMSSSSEVTITRAPNAHGGAHGGVHAQSNLGNGFASQAPTASLGQKIFDRPNKDKVTKVMEVSGLKNYNFLYLRL